jgi:hypothetical protein
MKKDEFRWTCSINGRGHKCVQDYIQKKREGKEHLGKPKGRRENVRRCRPGSVGLGHGQMTGMIY